MYRFSASRIQFTSNVDNYATSKVKSALIFLFYKNKSLVSVDCDGTGTKSITPRSPMVDRLKVSPVFAAYKRHIRCINLRNILQFLWKRRDEDNLINRVQEEMVESVCQYLWNTAFILCDGVELASKGSPIPRGDSRGEIFRLEQLEGGWVPVQSARGLRL